MAVAHVLVIHEDPCVRKLLSDVLNRQEVRVSHACGADEALAAMSREPVQVLFADWRTPGIDEGFVRRVIGRYCPLSIVILTDNGFSQACAAAVPPSLSGYLECLSKPVTQDKILAALAKTLDRVRRQEPREVPTPASRARGEGPRQAEDPAAALVAKSASMDEILGLVSKIAPTDVAVLIQGEPGVGKQSVARRIHRQSSRAGGPFVHVGCGGIPKTQLDVQLFGEPGRGAGEDSGRRPGLFERARGGTLFLDDVPRLPFWASVNLFDVLQQCAHAPSQGANNEPVSVRVIASATRDIESAVARNQFYSGLYYYLSAVRIYVPPLRERREDIPELAKHFLAAADGRGSAPAGAARRRFSKDALECLLSYDWPGNILELASVVAHAAILTNAEEIGRECVTDTLGKVACHDDSEKISVPLAGGLKEIERYVIKEVIRRCRGNKAAAARSLGLNRRKLYRLLEGRPQAENEPGSASRPADPFMTPLPPAPLRSTPAGWNEDIFTLR
jgi:DNA-binding NtrC family response regulator